MKERINIFIILSQILFVAFPAWIYAPLVYADPSPLPSPGSIGNCDICNTYLGDATGITSEVFQVCGVEPGSGVADTPFKTTTGQSYPSYASCKNQVSQEWADLGPKCASWQ